MGMLDFLKEIPLSALLREKLKDAEAEIGRLQRENSEVKATLASKDAEIAALNAQVRTLTERLLPGPDSALPDEQERLLGILAAHGETPEAVIARTSGMGEQLLSYHLEELRQRNFVACNSTAGGLGYDGSNDWFLQHAGRQYLVSRGQLK